MQSRLWEVCCWLPTGPDILAQNPVLPATLLRLVAQPNAAVNTLRRALAHAPETIPFSHPSFATHSQVSVDSLFRQSVSLAPGNQVAICPGS
jgi:hypothetical protein